MSLEDSAKRVAEFVKLAEKATPGPWVWTSDVAGPEDDEGCKTRGPIDVFEFKATGYCFNPELLAVDGRVISAGGGEYVPYEKPEDAAFIAVSRQMPSDFAEIVREARRFADALLDYESMSPLGNQAAKFLNATAPIVGEEWQG